MSGRANWAQRWRDTSVSGVTSVQVHFGSPFALQNYVVYGRDKAETSLGRQKHFFYFQDTTDVLPCPICFPVRLWIMDPHNRAATKNTSHGNEVLSQDTTHLIQRPCYHRGSLCQDPAGNRITRKPPDHRKETQTEEVWTCGTGMLPVHQVWPKPSCRAQWKGEEDNSDRGRDHGNLSERKLKFLILSMAIYKQLTNEYL